MDYEVIKEVKEENEKKKKYLREYRMHGRKIKRIEAEIAEIRSMKLYPSVNNDGMPHGSSQSDLSGYAATLNSRENELYLEGVKEVKAYKNIMACINNLSEPDERDVLFYRYIRGENWWKIADLMSYSERWVYNLHGKALKKLKIP